MLEAGLDLRAILGEFLILVSAGPVWSTTAVRASLLDGSKPAAWQLKFQSDHLLSWRLQLFSRATLGVVLPPISELTWILHRVQKLELEVIFRVGVVLVKLGRIL